MRVVHIVPISSKIAGTERQLMHVLPALRREGLDVQVLMLYQLPDPNYEFIEHMRSAGVPVTPHPMHPFKNLLNWRMPRIIKGLQTALTALSPDIVHTHLVVADLYGIPAAHFAGVHRIVCTRHNENWFRSRPIWQVVSWAYWQMTTLGVALSQSVYDYVLRYEHPSAHKIQLIYNGLPPAPRALSKLREELAISPSAPLVGSACRLIEQKGLSYAIDAFAEVRQRVDNAHYAIIGEGSQREALEAKVKNLGLEANIHFLGWRPDASRAIAAFDVYLAPSLWEGLSNSLLEAMNQELPIVGSRIPSFCETVVDGETGYLTPVKDAQSSVEPLVTLLSDRALARRMGQAGRKRLEIYFSLEQTVTKLIALYQTALET